MSMADSFQCMTKPTTIKNNNKKRNDGTIIQKDVLAPVFPAALFTYNSQDSKAINREMDKEDVVHIYNGILLSHKKEEQNSAICRDMDGPTDCQME